MERLTSKCTLGDCPDVYRGEDNQLIVCGPEVADSQIPLGDDERAVQVPAVLVVEAAVRLADEVAWTDVQRMFRAFTESAFRFETLSVYQESGAQQESLEHFLATGEMTEQEEPNEWDRMVMAHRQQGRTMRRVHTVRLPLTDYLRWELSFHEATSHEEIRILNIDEHPEFAAIEELGDAWLFDDRVGVRLCYDEDGQVTHPELVEDDELGEYLAWRDKSWEVATPLSEFMAGVS